MFFTDLPYAPIKLKIESKKQQECLKKNNKKNVVERCVCTVQCTLMQQNIISGTARPKTDVSGVTIKINDEFSDFVVCEFG